MAFNRRPRSSSLFIISEGQFYAKPSLKLDRLEQECAVLKTTEKENQRRLRTENGLLKQRIENLEKESAALADKLVHDQVTWAKETEEMHGLRNKLGLTNNKLHETQKMLYDAQHFLEDIDQKYQISMNKIRRMAEDNKQMKKQLEAATDQEKDLLTKVKDLTRKLDDAETKRKEETILARIKHVENIHRLVELRRKVAQLDIQREEQLALVRLCDKGGNQGLGNSLHDLQNELHLAEPENATHERKLFTMDSQWGINSDEELDAEIKDLENLDRTLSDITEGRHHSSNDLIQNSEDHTLPDFRNVFINSKIASTEDFSSASAYQQKERGSVLEPETRLSRSVNVTHAACHDVHECGVGCSEENDIPYDVVVYQLSSSIGVLSCHCGYNAHVNIMLKEITV